MVDATIKNAYRIMVDEKKYVAVGNIYDDTRGRYKDGESVKTSYILDEDKDVLVTKNAIYKIEWTNKVPISWDEYMIKFA